MFRPGAGEILILIVIGGLVYLRYKTQKATTEAKVAGYVRYLAPESQGGQGAWKTVLVGALLGVGLCLLVFYIVWRYFIAGAG